MGKKGVSDAGIVEVVIWNQPWTGDEGRTPSCLNSGFRHHASRCWDASPEPCLKLKMYLHSLSTTWQHNLNLASVYGASHTHTSHHEYWRISALDEVCQPEIWFCNLLLNLQFCLVIALSTWQFTLTLGQYHTQYLQSDTHSYTSHHKQFGFVEYTCCWREKFIFSCFALPLVCWSLVYSDFPSFPPTLSCLQSQLHFLCHGLLSVMASFLPAWPEVLSNW